MNEEVKKEISASVKVDVVKFTLTADGTYRAKANEPFVPPGYFVPLATVLKLVLDISKQQTEGFALVNATLRGLVKQTRISLEAPPSCETCKADRSVMN